MGAGVTRWFRGRVPWFLEEYPDVSLRTWMDDQSLQVWVQTRGERERLEQALRGVIRELRDEVVR